MENQEQAQPTQPQNHPAHPIPVIDIGETKKFAEVWKKNGIIVALDDVTLQFATDFTNTVLRQFYEQVVPQIVVATIMDIQRQAQEQQPQITLES